VSAAPRDLRLKSQRFREERQGDWRELEALLKRAEGGVLRKLNETEIVRLTVLYRAGLSSLSVARATSLDQGLIDYLESLCARTYFYVYGARSTLLQRISNFFARDWPQAAQALWRETLAALLLTVLGAVVAYVLVAQDPDWYYAFIPAELAEGRDPAATTKALHDFLYDKGPASHLSIFSTMLFTHNSGVALFAFALGFAFCLPTALLLIDNGCMLGAMIQLYASHGLTYEIVGWLFVHGVTELWAIILAGAAGFRIGWSLVFPGQRTRAEAAGAAGRQAAILMCGVVVMLFVAGMLEGFARQLVTLDWMRYAIAITSAVIWGVYLYFPRAKTSGGGAVHG
jgi:uncharacterized membrane protein SpoIIM required for sporulation